MKEEIPTLPKIETREQDDNQAIAIFAGGCFWCVEADFDKLDGVVQTISGYIGGTTANPTYKQVSRNNTGHYEAVKIIYDPSIVSYSELVEYFWIHIDPTDPDGQFCDRGQSYRTAIFVDDDTQYKIATTSKAALSKSGILSAPVITSIIRTDQFWPAETYHQNYYKKNPIRYRYYRTACGRDKGVDEIWANKDR